jgi:hypothetical protein
MDSCIKSVGCNYPWNCLTRSKKRRGLVFGRWLKIISGKSSLEFIFQFISMSPSLLYRNVLRIWNTRDEFWKKLRRFSLQDLTVLPTEFFRRCKTHIPSVIILPTESKTEMIRRWIVRR